MSRAVHLGLVLVMGIWGGAFIAVKEVLRPEGAVSGGLDWIELTWLRYVAASACLLALALTLDPTGLRRLLRESFGRTLLTGTMGVAAYNLALNYGETQVPATLAVLLIPVNPVLIMLLAATFLGEPLGLVRWAGSALAIAGLAAVVLAAPQGMQGWGSCPAAGVAACLGSALAWALYVLFSKSLYRVADPLAVTAATTALGTLPVLPFVMVQAWRGRESLGGWHAAAWEHLVSGGRSGLGWLAYLVLGSTVLAFLLYQAGLKHLPAGTVALYIYLMPVFGLLWGYGVLGERVTAAQLAGAGMLLAGVALASGRWGKKERPA